MATGKGRRRPKGKLYKPKRDNPAQSRKFIEAAKKLGVDQSGEAFSKALDKLVPKKRSDGNN